MPVAKINGININYKSEGNGFPLLLVHGIWLDLSLWDPENLFTKLSRKNRVIAFDCRGHGNSDKPASYTLVDHVTDILGLMDFLGIDKVNLLGISMGSYIAQAVAIEKPNRIQKLLLIVPKSNGLTSSLQRIMAEHADELSKLDDQGKMDFLNNLLPYNTDILRTYPKLLQSSLTPAQMEAANGALKGFDFRNDLYKVTAKTLVVSGKYDRLNPPSEGRICAEKINGAKFVEMQYSGHLPTIEEPDVFFQIVDSFLSEKEI